MKNPAQSWVPVPPHSDFPLENLPYGVFGEFASEAHVGVAIGDQIFDLHAATLAGLLDCALDDRAILTAPTLNRFLETGPGRWTAVRRRITELLREGDREILGCVNVDQMVVSRRDAKMHLPFAVGDYVDFYSSLEHATNMGKILRPGGESLLPNWRYLPIGYHGRSSSIVIDGSPIVRPSGQSKPSDAAAPAFGPTRSLDVELEMGFVTGPGSVLGRGVPVERAREHIFGLLLVNDWSARDIQAWEYQPLGPFLGKSFATSISPWVVTLDALEPYRCAAPPQDPAPLPPLARAEAFSYDITLQILLQTTGMREKNIAPTVIATSNFKDMYWTMAQQLAHITSNGARVRPGDLYASGTISGATPDSYGSLMELTWRGTKPLRLPSGEERGFLEDGDSVVMRGWAEEEGLPRIGFGDVRGTIEQAV